MLEGLLAAGKSEVVRLFAQTVGINNPGFCRTRGKRPPSLFLGLTIHPVLFWKKLEKVKKELPLVLDFS